MIKKLLFILIFPLTVGAQQFPMLDTNFAGTGFVNLNAYTLTYGRAVAIQPDNKIVVGGVTANQNTSPPIRNSHLLARYNEDGTLDTTFGIDGLVYGVNVKNGIMDIKILSDGKIIVGGHNGVSPFIGRLLPDGTYDATFGEDGIAYYLPTSSGFIKEIVVLDDGSVVGCGEIGYVNNKSMFLMKVTPTGQFDTTFGTNGIVISNYDYPTIVTTSMVQLQDGTLVVAGSAVMDASIESANSLLMVRYTANGVLDTTFGNNGLLLDNSVTSQANAISLDNQERIIVVGEKDVIPFGSGMHGHCVILRYNNDGTRDMTYNGTGHNIVNEHDYAEYASGLVLDANDNVYFSGHYFNNNVGNTTWRRFVAKFTPTGAFDTTFGTNGVYRSGRLSYTAEADFGSNNIAIDNSGRVVVGGYALGYMHTYLSLIRIVVDEASLGVSVPEQPTFSIYPNPVHDRLHIKASEDISTVTLYGINGQVLGKWQQTSSIDVAALAHGVYIVEVVFGNGTRQTNKFVK